MPLGLQQIAASLFPLTCKDSCTFLENLLSSFPVPYSIVDLPKPFSAPLLSRTETFTVSLHLFGLQKALSRPWTYE